MRIAVHLVPARTLPRVPWWSTAFVLGWGALLLALVWFAERSGSAIALCNFHRITGRPCPTCGSTRAVLALARGEPLTALAWNPLTVLALTALAGWLVFVAVTGKRPALDADRPMRIALWAAAALALALNWAWVWDRA